MIFSFPPPVKPATTNIEKTAPQKTQGMLSWMFGRFRRNKDVSLTALPGVLKHARTSDRPNDTQAPLPVRKRQPRRVTRN
ncbi:MAG: hypothetical protein MK102_07770 [Fuerstiella sp.]|nr:hypothetical protein [Fuerstiella sp.]